VNGVTRFREYVYAIFEQHITVLIATYVAPTCVSLDVRMGHCSSDDFSKSHPVVVVHLVANVYIFHRSCCSTRGRNASHYSRDRGCPSCSTAHSMGCSIQQQPIIGHGKPLYGSYSVSGCESECGGIRSDRILFSLFPIVHLQLFLKNNKIQAAAWKNATYTPTIRISHQSAVFVFFRFSDFCFVCVASSPILVYILENASAQPRSWNEYSEAIGS